MKRQINDMLTGLDGETIDPARVLWILGVVVFLAGAVVMMVQNKYDMQTYGIGLAAVLGGGAFGVKVKESSEPPAKG